MKVENTTSPEETFTVTLTRGELNALREEQRCLVGLSSRGNVGITYELISKLRETRKS